MSFFEDKKGDLFEEIASSTRKHKEETIAVTVVVGIISLLFSMIFGSCFVDSIATSNLDRAWSIVPTFVFVGIIWITYKLLRSILNSK